MKNIFLALSFLLLLLATAFTSSMLTRSFETERELEAYRKITDRRIEELEKEIRLLKTDMNVLEEGTRK